jgi:hypothetical protein
MDKGKASFCIWTYTWASRKKQFDWSGCTGPWAQHARFNSAYNSFLSLVAMLSDAEHAGHLGQIGNRSREAVRRGNSEKVRLRGGLPLEQPQLLAATQAQGLESLWRAAFVPFRSGEFILYTYTYHSDVFFFCFFFFVSVYTLQCPSWWDKGLPDLSGRCARSVNKALEDMRKGHAITSQKNG